ncbi:hypothetical protein [Fodinibius halophilus]|uniref:Uncharacterized protein n=1 Tax=Fodinibius halophilus TaxID=1736908 RepID=A0A6M1T545_9BACT|nr:hypothetical protein [Fodinibius halophilus]NGP89199.1 hypothetical protein [Fodinibius halophilus]
MNSQKLSLLVLILFSLATLQACTMAKISGKSSKPLMLNNPNVQTEIVRSVSQTKMKTFDYTGAIDVYEVLNEVIANSEADAVTNLTVKLKSDPATFFVNLVTLGIANAYKVEVTGDLVRLPNGISKVDTISHKELTNIKPSSNKEITTLHFDGYFQP